MKTGEQWRLAVELGRGRGQNEKAYVIAFVESADRSSRFDLHVEFRRQQMQMTQQTPQGPVQLQQEKVIWRIVKQGWE